MKKIERVQDTGYALSNKLNELIDWQNEMVDWIKGNAHIDEYSLISHLIKGVELEANTPQEGVVGNMSGIEVAHTSDVGDTRPHAENPEDCWCWDVEPHTSDTSFREAVKGVLDAVGRVYTVTSSYKYSDARMSFVQDEIPDAVDAIVKLAKKHYGKEG